MKARTRWAALALTTSIFAAPASAADAVRGKTLYQTAQPLACATSSCHGPDPTQNAKNILNGRNPQVILNAIAQGTGGMGIFQNTITTTDAADIAAYLTNPAAGTPAPAAKLTTATLAFPSQVIGTTSATMSATLTNSGTANLVLSAVALGGANPGDFTRAGSCAAPLTLAPAQSCTIDAAFKPGALGARSATVTLTHNASPNTSTVTLSGNGLSAPAPAAALSATTLSFGNQTVGTTSAARTVSISNTGTAALMVGTITTAGTNAGEFAATNCSNTSINPGASCTVSVTFTPSALSTRNATLTIPSNAAGSPHGVALTGNGTSIPVPAVTLNPTSLAFGNQTTGTTSAAKSVALTNSGTAPLSVNSIALTAPGFTIAHNCPISLNAGAGCTISVAFAPSAVTPFTSAVSVVTNAAGSPHSATLTGTGTAPTPTVPVATLSPLAVDFGMLPLNTTSSVRTVGLSNTGNAPLSISALALAGTNATDFTQTHNGPVGASLAAGATCSISVRFAPTAIGARSATLALTSNASGAVAVDLKGAGIVQSSAVAQLAPSQVVFASTRLGRTSDDRTVRIRNAGTTPLVISSVNVTGDFTQESECVKTLAPGANCEVKVRFKPTVLGTRTGELSIGSNATGSPQAVKLSGLAVAPGGKDSSREVGCDDEAACSQSMLPFFRR